jgi:hypothetical protein
MQSLNTRPTRSLLRRIAAAAAAAIADSKLLPAAISRQLIPVLSVSSSLAAAAPAATPHAFVTAMRCRSR